MTDLETARTRLESALAEARARLGHITANLDEPHDPDSAERAVQMEDDEVLENEAQLLAREIASLERALRRVAEGTYGACMACGAAISPGRLDARPEAALCIACARAA